MAVENNDLVKADHYEPIFIITELGFDGEYTMSWGDDFPDRTPVGPFRTRREAEDWVMAKCRDLKAIGANWQIAPLIPPW